MLCQVRLGWSHFLQLMTRGKIFPVYCMSLVFVFSYHLQVNGGGAGKSLDAMGGATSNNGAVGGTGSVISNSFVGYDGMGGGNAGMNLVGAPLTKPQRMVFEVSFAVFIVAVVICSSVLLFCLIVVA